MFKFGGFKASLKLGSPSKKKEIYENGPDLSVGGAYRAHREEFFGRGGVYEQPRKLSSSMVKLPLSHKDAIKTSKSTTDLANPNNLPSQLRKSAPDVSTDPRGGTSNNRDSSALHRQVIANGKGAKRDSKKQEKELKEIEKKRIAEQKRKDKLAAQEQARQDKLRIQRDREIAQQQARDVKLRKDKEKNKKKTAPQPAQTSSSVPVASNPKPIESQIPIPPAPPQRANPLGQRSNYSTNTLESSTSHSSGPPPYSAPEPNARDSTGNTSFSRPAESSWDLVSEHRHQISRTVAGGAGTKQMMLDLQFSFDKAQQGARGNSEV